MGAAALLLLLIALIVLVAPAHASAHPADRLVQNLLVRLTPGDADVSIALGGGLLANERVLTALDPNGDKQISPTEARAWTAAFVRELRVSLDDQAMPVTVADMRVTVPDAEQFHLGLSPLIVAFRVALPPSEPLRAVPHQLTIRNDYLIDRTDFRVAVQADAGIEITSKPLPSPRMRIEFRVDPGAAGRSASQANSPDSATAWGRSGIIAKAQRTLERPKTPALFLSLVAIFLVMGALHALQPGHGKTLVAAYLVATGGTPRDAITLAGIVTFTHTLSVFALGLATMAASQVFLPSRVIPTLSLVSGLLVVGMGAFMLRGAVVRLRGKSNTDSHHRHEPGHEHDRGDAHDHHDHAALSEEEHARLHLGEVEQALRAPLGSTQRRVSFRSLLTLGVSGGLAPCPDALAILLLAVGINQLAFGLLAILAFSVGLAGVLVGFGLTIALAGPLWSRRSRTGRGRWFGRLAAYSPVLSGTFVLLLGLAMLWRARSGF